MQGRSRCASMDEVLSSRYELLFNNTALRLAGSLDELNPLTHLNQRTLIIYHPEVVHLRAAAALKMKKQPEGVIDVKKNHLFIFNV